jgi:uncharacterized membrane protein YvlD (DUF360 family)
VKGTRHAALRIAITWLITAGTLMLLNPILDGLTVKDWRAALGMAALVGILNALVWPLFVRFALPITVLTLGLAALLLNGLLVLAAAALEPGVVVSGFWTALVIALALTLVNTVVTAALAIDDDNFYYRNVVRRQAKRRGAIRSDVPAVFFLEIDGLAHDVLQRAIRDGNANTMGRWLREGSHRLLEWETDWSSQTGASQTGLLHGSNEDIPAFRWWDKESGRAVASSAPKDVAAIEGRISDGKGLLFADGASRANMYSGDAPHSLLTISTVLKRGRGKIGEDYFAYFANPYNLIRTILLVIGDVASEIKQQMQQKRLDIQPRVHRGLFPYPLMRAWMTVVQRDLQTQALIGDLYAGRPVVYSTFSGYDEMAHHAGIERAETLGILRKLDLQFARLAAAAAEAPRPVQFVVLSDHGQTQGATFLARYGKSLEQVVKEACDTQDVEALEQGDEGWMYLGASMTEAAGAKGLAAKGLRRATKGKHVDDAVLLGPGRKQAEAEAEAGLPEVVVMASGNLGLISFPREPGRVSLERIAELYPAVLPTLCSHPGIGFVLVRSELRGAIALGGHGTHFLDEDRVEGDDPLAPFGANAAEHVRRTDRFEHCADIMVNSAYWPETGEVAAFEELVGSHGGLGGTQSRAFALIPRGWDVPAEPIVGAAELHRLMRAWLASIGHDAYAEAAVVA